MQLNKANFLTWYDNNNYNQLPVINSNKCAKPLLAWHIGDTMSFVINKGLSSLPTNVNLCRLDKTVVQSLGNLSTYSDTSFTGSKGYATFTCPSVAVGDYILSIGTSYYSSPISIISDTNLFNTAKFKFRHKFQKNEVDYALTSMLNFHQEFRLFCSFGEVNIISSKEILIDADSLVPREYNTKLSSGYKCTVYSMDIDRHFALADMVTCSDLYINNERYQSDGSITANRVGLSGLSNATFNVQDYSMSYPKR